MLAPRKALSPDARHQEVILLARTMVPAGAPKAARFTRREFTRECEVVWLAQSTISPVARKLVYFAWAATTGVCWGVARATGLMTAGPVAAAPQATLDDVVALAGRVPGTRPPATPSEPASTAARRTIRIICCPRSVCAESREESLSDLG